MESDNQDDPKSSQRELESQLATAIGGEPTQATTPNSNTTKVKSNWGLKWALYLIAALFVVYMLVVPTIGYVIERLSSPKSGYALVDMTLLEKIRLHSVSGVVMLIFLALGGTIGSFLNVFIFRVPRSKPLMRPPSSCASCGKGVRGKDNIPVFGWILLSGRCRFCQAAISPRYPIIEAIVAVVFITLYYVELLSGGDNLPVREPNLYRGIVWILLYTKWDLVGMYLCHSMMLSLLLSIAMMNVDGFRLPRKYAIGLMIVFGGLMLLFPALQPAPAPIATSLIGAACGMGLGWIIQVLLPVERPKDATNEPTTINMQSDVADQPKNPIDQSLAVSDQTTVYGESAMAPSTRSDALFALALVGVTLGPQAVFSIALMMLPWGLAYLLFTRVRKLPVTLLIFSVAFFHQLCWRQIHDSFSYLRSMIPY